MEYRALRYSERLDAAEVATSAGSKYDSCDSAASEALNSLFKVNLVRNLGSWKAIDDLEIGTTLVSAQ